MNGKGVIDTLNDYITQVFDTDGDGLVTFKELFSVFPNMAVPIVIAFVDILVLAAEYRVWDFGKHVTGNPLLAVGFVLVSAVPFLLGQVMWLYPRAIIWQKMISIGFIGLSLYTSAQFGLADLTKEYDVNSIYQFLVELTIFYIGASLVYVIVDPTIKANRMKKKAQDDAKWAIEKNSIANDILKSLREGLEARKALEQQFGVQEVERMLGQLAGKKQQKPQQQTHPQNQPVRQFAKDEETVNPPIAGSQSDRTPRKDNSQNS